MALEEDGSAHGVLLLNSNAMGKMMPTSPLIFVNQSFVSNVTMSLNLHPPGVKIIILGTVFLFLLFIFWVDFLFISVQ